VAALEANELAVPSIIFFEVGLLLRRGRLNQSVSLRDWHVGMRSLGIREVSLSAETAIRASDLDNLSGDPIDRIIVATALVEDAMLLTADQSLLDWPGPLRRQDATR
jgi:PIN domain nuclease of toxin-antitoxin system